MVASPRIKPDNTGFRRLRAWFAAATVARKIGGSSARFSGLGIWQQILEKRLSIPVEPMEAPA